ncbi:GILT-like protein 1 [Penaeus japonicus]|uniref:GILT-like protein 1 n=1 Tax=Penaeus japonicus TaxID=27405 RepID=UPI001C70BB29|nr:GILT-like protein 1 [Penaeus japonicus]
MPSGCCNYCPPTPAICPLTGLPIMSRVRRRAQRQCGVDGHCPSDSVCCPDQCHHHAKICKKRVRDTNAVAPRSSKVTVTILMTSASADSQWFLSAHLTPLEYSLRDFLSVEIVPFGLVENGECQHGRGDCLGNRLISCSVRHLASRDGGLAFSTCLMKHRNHLASRDQSSILSAALSCAHGSRRSTKAFYKCSVGPEGYQLFAEAGKRQSQLVPSLSYVPTVMIDGEVVVSSYQDIMRFSVVLCDKLSHVPGARSYCQSYINALAG